MFRKPASLIMLFLLVVSALAFAFNVRPVKSYVWTETIYIRADGSIQPPIAPISSVDNVTYTLTDNITGNVPDYSSAIIIERDNITIDGAGQTLQGTQAQYSIGIEFTGKSNVTIKNMKITAYTYGIALYSSSNNSVSGDNVTANNEYGIYLVSSSNNSIAGNNVIANNEFGIYLSYSSNNNSVSGNNITSSWDGIVLYSSSNNSVSGNNITNNRYRGIALYSSSNNVFHHNNFVNNAGQVYSDNSTNVWDNGAPEALPIYLYISAALAIIIAVGAVAFIVRRKKKPPEEAKSP